MNLRSRKTIMAIIAVIVAALGFVKSDFQLVGDPASVLLARG